LDITNCLLAFFCTCFRQIFAFPICFFLFNPLDFFASTIVVCSILFFSIIQDYDDCCCFLFWVCCFLCFFFRGFFCLLYFLYFEEVFDEVVAEEKKELVSSCQIENFFLGGISKCFWSKKQQFKVVFCLS
jgi:hypothetical protein